MTTFKIIDLFCGAGGVSLGFSKAKSGSIPIANVVACLNHDQVAIRSHSANFPSCRHFVEDIRKQDTHDLPRKQPGDKSVWVLWASLECTHFSNAKTGPRKADSRTLAWELYRYIDHIQPDIVMIENVREFMSWGDLDEKGMPVSKLKGRHYLKWRERIEAKGFRYASRLLNSADYGSYQSRLRYFAMFAKPNIPIRFPEPTHDRTGRYGLPKWRAVKDVLNLENHGDSIFNRKKPLSPNTLERILSGLVKFVPGGNSQYLVKNYSGKPDDKVVSLELPGPTITTVPHESLVSTTFLIQYNGTGGSLDVNQPCNTIPTKDRFGVVRWIDNQYGTGVPSGINEPCHTLPSVPKKNFVSAFIINQNYSNGPASIDEPARTITAGRKWQYLVNPQYKNRGSSIDASCFTLIARMDKAPPYIVTAEGLDKSNPGDFSRYKDKNTPVTQRILWFMDAFGISDIKMRMLEIDELKRIQGLGDDYILHGTKSDQKKFIGNAVVPDVVTKWIEAIHQEIFTPNKLNGEFRMVNQCT